jgi:hypothetical protein
MMRRAISDRQRWFEKVQCESKHNKLSKLSALSPPDFIIDVLSCVCVHPIAIFAESISRAIAVVVENSHHLQIANASSYSSLCVSHEPPSPSGTKPKRGKS